KKYIQQARLRGAIDAGGETQVTELPDRRAERQEALAQQSWEYARDRAGHAAQRSGQGRVEAIIGHERRHRCEQSAVAAHRKIQPFESRQARVLDRTVIGPVLELAGKQSVPFIAGEVPDRVGDDRLHYSVTATRAGSGM